MVRQNFDRDDSVQTGVFGAVHLTHSSGTHSGENFVGPEAIARGQGHLGLDYNPRNINASHYLS